MRFTRSTVGTVSKRTGVSRRTDMLPTTDVPNLTGEFRNVFGRLGPVSSRITRPHRWCLLVAWLSSGPARGRSPHPRGVEIATRCSSVCPESEGPGLLELGVWGEHMIVVEAWKKAVRYEGNSGVVEGDKLGSWARIPAEGKGRDTRTLRRGPTVYP